MTEQEQQLINDLIQAIERQADATMAMANSTAMLIETLMDDQDDDDDQLPIRQYLDGTMAQ